MSAPRKITSGHHIQFSSYINRLREGAARSKYGSRIACTDRFLGQCHRGWTGMLDAPPTGETPNGRISSRSRTDWHAGDSAR